jgi:hypothetical protein
MSELRCVELQQSLSSLVAAKSLDRFKRMRERLEKIRQDGIDRIGHAQIICSIDRDWWLSKAGPESGLRLRPVRRSTFRRRT